MASELQPGTEVGGYVIEAVLGRGGTSTVYSARHPEIGKQVAVKVLETDLRESPGLAERMKREARTIVTIDHPNIVDVLSFDVLPDGRCFLIMEILHGETLAHRLQRGPLGKELTEIFLAVIDALHAVHAAGIVHRDLKPGNVMLAETRTGQRVVKLLDFGVAKVLGDSSDSHTKTGTVLGTPFYLAPEQGRADKIDQRADIYSLGVMLYEAVVGAKPFTAPTPLEIVAKHVHMLPPEPASVTPGIAPALNDLLMEMLAKRPEDRPALARVRGVLQSVAGGALEVPRRRSRALLAAPLVILLGCIAAIAVLRARSATVEPRLPAQSVAAETQKPVVAPPASVDPPSPAGESNPSESGPAQAGVESVPVVPRKARPIRAIPSSPARESSHDQIGYLTVTAQPWVSVSIDGVEVAEETPLRRRALTTGVHKLAVSNAALGFRKEIDIMIPNEGEVRFFVDANEGKISRR